MRMIRHCHTLSDATSDSPRQFRQVSDSSDSPTVMLQYKVCIIVTYTSNKY